MDEQQRKEICEKIMTLAKKKKSFLDICKMLELKDYEVAGLITIMRQEGYGIDFINGEINILKQPIKNNDIYTVPNNLEHIKLLLISDTHICSRFDRIDILNYLYEKAENRGVSAILHSGDFTDGRSTRPEHVYELKELSYEGQVQYCVDNYPKSNIPTYIIQGNHDDWWYKSTGSEIVKTICKQRPDLIYLGADIANMKIGNLKIRLFHGHGSGSYAKSYKLQKTLDAIPVDERPDILQTGHVHNSFYMKQDHTHCFQTGCLEDNTPFINSLGLKNEKSVWWLDITMDNKGNVYSIVPELETFDKKIPKKR